MMLRTEEAEEAMQQLEEVELLILMTNMMNDVNQMNNHRHILVLIYHDVGRQVDEVKEENRRLSSAMKKLKEKQGDKESNIEVNYLTHVSLFWQLTLMSISCRSCWRSRGSWRR